MLLREVYHYPHNRNIFHLSGTFYTPIRVIEQSNRYYDTRARPYRTRRPP